MADPIVERITVLASLEDVYHLWENFENFPRFMEHIKSVTKTGDRTSHWVADGPLGTPVEWEAETTVVEENRRIAWSSRADSAVKTSGQVAFRELGINETEITVNMQYEAPAGAAGQAIAELLANPEGRVREDLRRFKEFVESTSERLHTTPDDRDTASRTILPGPPAQE